MGFQKNPSDLLYEAITAPKKKLAFFVGQGVSINSGLKDYRGFSEQFLCSVGPANWADKNNRDIRLISERLRPEVLLQVIQQVYGDNILEFLGVLDIGIPNPNHYFLALALLKGHCIFTTNVDTFIERACENLGVAYMSMFYMEHYKDFLNKQPLDFSSKLFKLHGSIEPNETRLEKYESIRFALDRVGLGLDENTRETLSTCLQERDFIFLGSSGNDFFNVHPELLRLDSDQKIYWFKFRPNPLSLECISNSRNFRTERDELLKEASKDLLSEKWKDISLLDILIRWESRSFLIEGNSNFAIEDILKKLASSNVSPVYQKLNNKLKNFAKDQWLISEQESFASSWIVDITDFKRHLCSAMLFIRLRDFTKADQELKIADEYAKDDWEKAKVDLLRSTTYSIIRRIGKEKPRKEDILKAMEKFQIQCDLVSMIEEHLELANIIRIERNFSVALEELDKIEKELVVIKPELQKQKKTYEWPRLMANLFFLRGLVYGLGSKEIFKDKIIGLECFDKASDFASQAGDVARKAAILNARGLIIYQLAERTNVMLREAETSFNEALVLNSKIGDPLSCFHPSHNLLLVHRLRSLRDRPIISNYWLKKAWEESNRAQDYLNQIKTGSCEPIIYQIELDFRKAQLMGLKKETDKANREFKKVLDYCEGKNDIHQQARIWQELLSLAKDLKEIKNCLSHLLNTIELLFQSKEEQDKYENDLLLFENIMDMLIDAYDKANEIKDQEYLNKIKKLMHRGEVISKLEEIQEKAKAVCEKSKGTVAEEIAYSVCREIQKWEIGNHEEMTKKVEDVTYILKTKVADLPENEYILNKIEAMRHERDLTKQYETFHYVIGLIPTMKVISAQEFDHTLQDLNQSVKDSFTRMIKEREETQRELIVQKQAENEKVQKRKEEIARVRAEISSLFSEKNSQKRGKALEGVLNSLFRVYGILIREAFVLKGDEGEGIVEQIDGVIEIDGHYYFVEMKWWDKPIGVPEISQHLVRVFLRANCHAIIISASDFTGPAVSRCKQALQQKVVILCTLQEIMLLLEREGELCEFIRKKARAAIIDREPFVEVPM